MKRLLVAAMLLCAAMSMCAYNVTMSYASSGTHGLSKTPEYKIWVGLKTRCFNPNRSCFKRYGGRGITVCERWKANFLAFYRDMGPRPSPQHTIERKDNNGPYSPSNCVWLPAGKQSANRNKYKNPGLSHKHNVNGKLMTVSEIHDQFGIKPQTFKQRIRRGWSVTDALTGTSPSNPVSRSRKSLGRSKWWSDNGKRFLVRGKSMTAPEIERRHGIKVSTFLQRIRLGWSATQAALTDPSAYRHKS